MALSIIKANPMRDKTVWEEKTDYLKVSEFFCDTIQGEGITAGTPAAFLRLQGCTLNCQWCDTSSIWKTGGEYTFDELFELMIKADLIRKFREGQHLVITGGSPLLQQDQLVEFLEQFKGLYDFLPVIEVENECMLYPTRQFQDLVTIWNNSPKLCNSGLPWKIRYKPEVIGFMSELNNAWFKFVISDPHDWDEIKNDFLEREIVRKDQIILMPEGATRQQLKERREMVVNMAIQNNVRYCTREQIVLWSDKVGV